MLYIYVRLGICMDTCICTGALGAFPVSITIMSHGNRLAQMRPTMRVTLQIEFSFGNIWCKKSITTFFVIYIIYFFFIHIVTYYIKASLYVWSSV